MSKLEERILTCPVDELWRVYKNAKLAIADNDYTEKAMRHMHDERGKTHLDMEAIRNMSLRIMALAEAELVRRGEIGTEN